MAYKITHRSTAQEVRFPNQRAAEGYAERVGGGLEKWDIVPVGPAEDVRRAAPAAHDEPETTRRRCRG